MIHRPRGIGLLAHSTALGYWPVAHLLVRLRATVLQTWDMLQTDLQMWVHTLTVDQPTAPDRLLLMAHQIWDLQQTSHAMMIHRPQGIGLVVHSTALGYWPVSHLLVRLRSTVLQTWDMLQTDLQMRVHTLTVDQPTAHKVNGCWFFMIHIWNTTLNTSVQYQKTCPLYMYSHMYLHMYR